MKKKLFNIKINKYYFILQVVLALAFFTAASEVWTLQAAQTQEMSLTEQCDEGLLPLEEISISGEEAEEIVLYEPKEETLWNQLFSALFRMTDGTEKEEAYWHQYSNYYLYNLMSEEEQAYYDMLDEACMDFLLSGDNAVYNKANDIYYLPSVVSEELTLDEMKAVYAIFKYNNGQYYFINSRLITLSKNGVSGMAPGIYKVFADGEARAAATEDVKEQLENFSGQIAGKETPEEQTNSIHDLIIDSVSYNSAINSSGFDDETELSQTIYSVLCMDKTVCAGYAQTFAVLCNRAGIDAITVTSATHEWNKVRLNDSWYNVDCTWDDQGGGAIYTYYLRSDEVYDNGTKPASHAEEALWDGYLPLCTLDAAPESSNTPGTLPEITQQTAKPVLQAVWQPQEQGYFVTAACEDAYAVIYYTLSGGLPSPARTKSSVYRQSFFVEAGCEIQMVAVSDARFDSEVEQMLLTMPTELTASEGEPESESNAAETEAAETVTSEDEGESKDDLTEPADMESMTGEESSLPDATDTESETAKTKNSLKKGDTFVAGGNTYQITRAGSSAAVTFLKTSKKTTNLVIPAAVKYKGVKYQVTAMASKACSGYSKIKTVTIGKNVKKIPAYAFRNCTALKKVTIGSSVTVIGKCAFKNCGSLKKVIIKTKKLSRVGANAFRGIDSAAKISVPAKKLKGYQILLKGKGQSRRVKFIKIS